MNENKPCRFIWRAPLDKILLVSLLVWLLRAGEVRVDYGTPIDSLP